MLALALKEWEMFAEDALAGVKATKVTIAAARPPIGTRKLPLVKARIEFLTGTTAALLG